MDPREIELVAVGVLLADAALRDELMPEWPFEGRLQAVLSEMQRGDYGDAMKAWLKRLRVADGKGKVGRRIVTAARELHARQRKERLIREAAQYMAMGNAAEADKRIKELTDGPDRMPAGKARSVDAASESKKPDAVQRPEGRPSCVAEETNGRGAKQPDRTAHAGR